MTKKRMNYNPLSSIIKVRKRECVALLFFIGRKSFEKNFIIFFWCDFSKIYISRSRQYTGWNSDYVFLLQCISVELLDFKCVELYSGKHRELFVESTIYFPAKRSWFVYYFEIYYEYYDLLRSCLWISEATCYMDAFRSLYEYTREYCTSYRDGFICCI